MPRLSAVTFLAILISLTGCVTPPDTKNMAPKLNAITKRFSGSIGVNVSGGHMTDIMKYPDISNEDFTTVLVTSLNKTGLFKSVVETNPDYKLQIKLVKIIRDIGFTCTTKVVAEWQLTCTRDAQVVSDEFITTAYSRRYGNSFVAESRFRQALEYAVRDNIAEGMERLAKLNLNP